ncbi:MAG: hypothetical protein J5850_04965 [Clostridia bacterium]|nr:hypothetical protein [Clostridia bacterium]
MNKHLYYPVIIVVSMVIVSVINILFNPSFPPYVYPVATVILTVAVIAVDGLVAWLIRAMPEKHFDYSKKIFHTGKREIRFYEFIGVKKWKDCVPELGMFTGLRKNKISDPRNPEYLRRYILEACYGIIIHYASVPASLMILLLDFGMYKGASNLWLTVALPVAFVNMVLILLPAFILKYNLPKLVKLYDHLSDK